MDVCHENFLMIERTKILYSRLILLNQTSLHLKNYMDVYSQQIVYDELLSSQV
jgi:hypothetical protein